MQRVILNSGGMDSFLLSVHHMWHDAAHVFVDIGQQYLQKEAVSAARIAKHAGKELHYVKGAAIAVFEHESGIIPYRNAEMILCAAQFGDTIGLGVIADEVNSDKSPAFFEALERVLDISHTKQYWTEGKTHHIETPLLGATKAEHIKSYLAHGGELAPLLETVSCYDGGKHHCGQCASCFKRWVALAVATGQVDVQYFVTNPWEGYSIDYLRSRMPTYSSKRLQETRAAYALVGIDL